MRRRRFGRILEELVHLLGEPSGQGGRLLDLVEGNLSVRPPRPVVPPFWPVSTPDQPLVIAGLAAFVVMLLTKPGTGDPTPGLTSFGESAVAMAVCAFVLGVAQAILNRRG